MNTRNEPRESVRSSVNVAAPQGNGAELEPQYDFYQDVMRTLDQAHLPFLVGGGIAFTYYTGIQRKAKDLDLFVLPEHFASVMDALSEAGFTTHIRFAHWIGKATKGDDFVDIIFGSGNGICAVDQDWFDYAVPVELLGLAVKLCPPEEMIWSKAFVMERDRFDGADVAHLLVARNETLDWSRLLRRFNDEHWRVLFSHIILLGFIYPCERNKIPDWVQSECLRRYRYEMKSDPPQERLCQGTLFSWSEYLFDIEQREYMDGRHVPRGNLTPQETTRATAIWKQGEEGRVER